MARKRNTENDIVLSSGGATARRKPSAGSARPRRTNAVPAEPLQSPEEVTVLPSESSAPVAAPSREEIAVLAYSYWEARGYQGGSAEEDWLRAEQELSARHTASSAAHA